MNKKKKLYYLIVCLAILSMGAAYSATSMIEIGPFATITGGFPSLDFVDTSPGDTSWEVVAGGDQIHIGRQFSSIDPFAIFDDADDNALVVSGRGIAVGDPEGAINPASALTVGGGTIVLDADGTNVSDWAILGGGGFALIDLANVTLPFIIDEAAANTSFIVQEEGDILMAGGAFNSAAASRAGVNLQPDAALHVLRTDDSTGLTGVKVEDASSSAANRELMELVNNGGVQFALDNTNTNERWQFTNNSIGDFNVSRVGTGGPEMRMTRTGRFTSGPGGLAALDSRPNGNLFIAGTLFEASDRDKKENFKEVDCEAILDQIAALSITTWNYKSDSQEIRHMGPVAQDFRSAFKLGDSDKTIATTDKAGVTLAAIKALNSKLKIEAAEKDGQIKTLESELIKMDSRLKRLEEALQQVEVQ